MGRMGNGVAARLFHPFSLLIWLLAIVLPGSVLGCEKTLRWEDDPPFSMQLANGEIGGIYVDSNRLVLKRLGCQVRLVKLPWARALKELELGRLDVLPGAFRKPEREQYAYFSGPFGKPSRNILFMHKDALARYPIRHLPELRDSDLRLGAQIGVSYGEAYQQLMGHQNFAARVSFSANRNNLWQMIAHRRIDGVIADELTGIYEIRQLGLDEAISATQVVVANEASEVALSKRSNTQAFVTQYRLGLERLVEDGSHAHIVQHYLDN